MWSGAMIPGVTLGLVDLNLNCFDFHTSIFSEATACLM